MKVYQLALLALFVSFNAHGDLMSIQCDPELDIAKEKFPKTYAYGLGTDGGKEWHLYVKKKENDKLATVVEMGGKENTKGLIATEEKNEKGYKQYHFDCGRSCWSAEEATLKVYKVGTRNGRKLVDGPMPCLVSVD